MSRHVCGWPMVFGLVAAAGFSLWTFASAAGPGKAISAAEASQLCGGQSADCYYYYQYYCMNAPGYYCASYTTEPGQPPLQGPPCVAQNVWKTNKDAGNKKPAD